MVPTRLSKRKLFKKTRQIIEEMSEEASRNAWNPSKVWDEFSRRLARQEAVTFVKTKHNKEQSTDMITFQAGREEARLAGRKAYTCSGYSMLTNLQTYGGTGDKGTRTGETAFSSKPGAGTSTRITPSGGY